MKSLLGCIDFTGSISSSHLQFVVRMKALEFENLPRINVSSLRDVTKKASISPPSTLDSVRGGGTVNGHVPTMYLGVVEDGSF